MTTTMKAWFLVVGAGVCADPTLLADAVRDDAALSIAFDLMPDAASIALELERAPWCVWLPASDGLRERLAGDDGVLDFTRVAPDPGDAPPPEHGCPADEYELRPYRRDCRGE